MKIFIKFRKNRLSKSGWKIKFWNGNVKNEKEYKWLIMFLAEKIPSNSYSQFEIFIEF